MRRSTTRLCAWSIGLLVLLLVPATAAAIDEFPITNPCLPAVPAGTGTCQPAGITAGPDGNLWFTEENGNRIGRITPGGAITEFTAGLSSGALPVEIVPGSDGRLWFTEPGTKQIGAINPATGVISEYGSTVAPPDGITPGPPSDPNSLWFTEYNAGTGTSRIGRITTAGNITNEFSLSGFSAPSDITVGPDNRLWFTQGGNSAGLNRIGAITTGGTADHYPLTGGLGDPSGITPSASGLWFTEYGASQVRRITTNGDIGAPTPVGSGPSAIATGSDGALWFTETLADRIGRITTSGVLTNEFPVPTPNSEPGGIAAGPDGALWFTEFVGNKIGRIATAPPFVPPPPLPVVTPPPTAKKTTCKVPKLKGLTAKQARKKLKRARCRFRLRGKGRVTRSKPKAGARTTKRVVVTLKQKRRTTKRSRGGGAAVAHRSA